jgi:chromosomal replication initiation ATPase DnaA
VDRESGGVTADDIWDQGAAALRDQLAPATWAAWFHGVHARSFDGSTLVLGVPSSLAAERIRSSYSGMLTDAIFDTSGSW